jgi:hypothetical protein
MSATDTKILLKMMMVDEPSKLHVTMDYKVSNVCNIQSEHNYVILSSIIQLVNHMFRSLYLTIIRLFLAYRGLCYITSVSNGRRDLVYSGQVHELN